MRGPLLKGLGAPLQFSMTEKAPGSQTTALGAEDLSSKLGSIPAEGVILGSHTGGCKFSHLLTWGNACSAELWFGLGVIMPCDTMRPGAFLVFKLFC